MTPHGHFHWNELNTRDARRAMDFYSKSIGWTFDEMSMGDGTPYYVCMQGDKPAGGIFTMEDPMFDGLPDHWLPYLSVDDIDAAIAKVKAEGGQVKREPFDVPGVGRIAIVAEPGGAVLGWMTPADNG